MRTSVPSTTKQRLAIQAVGLSLVLLFSLFIATSVRAEEDPANFVRHLGDRATTIFGDSDLSAGKKRQAFREVLKTHFDLDLISRAVLGKHWRQASAEQKQTYRRLFEDYLIATNARRLERYSGEGFQVVGARDKGSKGTYVASEIVRPSGPPVRLVWRLRRVEQSWRVVDLAVEGVSMLMTHRSDFDAAIRQSGGRLDGLFNRLRVVIARLDGAAA